MKRVQNRWKMVYQILIYFLLIVLSPLILLIVGFLILYKKVVLRLIVKYFKPKLLELLSNYDAFHATDRFWEDSRASSGIILLLKGTISLDQVREDFFHHVIEAKSSTAPESKLFPKLTSIPHPFGGYYFWQKANYFLIHEHIRPITKPVDEDGLKKYAGTILSLPFPNKRPLWEILVFTSYNCNNTNTSQDNAPSTSDNAKELDGENGETNTDNCSALVIRMHQSVADPDLILQMISLICNKNKRGSSESLKLSESCQVLKDLRGTATLQDSGHGHGSPITMEKVIRLLKRPKHFHNFVASFCTPSPLNPPMLEHGAGATVSWNSLADTTFDKIIGGQNLTVPSLQIATIIGALGSSKGGSFENSSSTETSVLCSLKNKSDSVSENKNSSWDGYMFVNGSEECSSIMSVLNINGQIASSLRQFKTSHSFLKLLSIFPHPIVRYLTFHLLKGATIAFQECDTNLGELLKEAKPPSFKSRASLMIGDGELNDLIFIGGHQLLDVIPLCGLNFRHCAISATAIKFQDSYKISLTINSSLLSSAAISKGSLDAKPILDVQGKADEITQQLPVQLEKIFEDSKDENGFVMIMIT